METKLIAAEIATGAGVTTIITSSRHPENVFNIIEYHNSMRSPSTPSTPRESLSEGANTADSEDPGSRLLIRPPHTVFTPAPAPMRDLKSWTSHTLFPSGSVIIDTGAHHVLSRRESGGRLLAAGVLGVIGVFASGQAVRIVIRRRPDGAPSDDADAARASYANALEMTRPSTPTLLAACSISSSVASLEPLSRSISSMGPAEDMIVSKTLQPLSEDDVVLVEKEATSETDVVEVGRGLANYNSAQITRVKGLNR